MEAGKGGSYSSWGGVVTLGLTAGACQIQACGPLNAGSIFKSSEVEEVEA